MANKRYYTPSIEDVHVGMAIESRMTPNSKWVEWTFASSKEMAHFIQMWKE